VRLKRLHSDSTLNSPRYQRSLKYWRLRSTARIVSSLGQTVGNSEPLTVKKDGTIIQGNTRIKVLEERGFDVDSLPYVLHD
jgi:hypothetical protein